MDIQTTEQSSGEKQTKELLSFRIQQLSLKIHGLDLTIREMVEKLKTSRFHEDVEHSYEVLKCSLKIVYAFGDQSNSWGAFVIADKENHVKKLENLWEEMSDVHGIFNTLCKCI